MRCMDLGTATIEPSAPVIAGSLTTLHFAYTAGHPIDDTGYLKIVFRYAGDFGRPQFADPAAPNYCRVQATGDCRIVPRWDPKGHTRPWGRSLFLQVVGGFLDGGQQIVVVFGDTSQGSPGWQMQTFCEETFEFKTLVDPIATYEFKELPHSPTLRVVAGQPVRAICIAPSQVALGQPFAYHLKLEDRWGNPTGHPAATTHSGFSQPGIHTLSAGDQQSGLSAQSNPIAALAEAAPLHPYWADLHGQSEETIGTNSIQAYFAFARDDGLLDISAHQGNDFQVTDEFWDTINRTTRAFYEPGRFVTFPGYEWSGNTPLGGDRNVYFASEGGHISHSSTDLLPGKRSAYSTSATAAELFATLARQQGPAPLAFAHVGGRYADVTMHDPAIEVGVEVHSAWGTFEWLVEDALRQGYRIGICANSDGHKCRPGASYPGDSHFGSLGGLTCVLAGKLDRESVVAALRARHFYATTGNRCLVDVRVEAGQGRSAMMGDVIRAARGSTPRLYVRVAGTAPVESIQVRNGLEVVETLRPYGERDLGHRLKVVWSGAEVRGRARMVSWDGSLHVQDNALRAVTAVNFWNPEVQPAVQPDCVSWRSVTTGGTAGLILELETPSAGVLELETLQGRLTCPIQSLSLEPLTVACGGLGKQIAVYRLPAGECPREFSFDLSLGHLHEGDNPIYVRVTQEDGHMAWTSPVYLVA